jgi:hypothetical protein
MRPIDGTNIYINKDAAQNIPETTTMMRMINISPRAAIAANGYNTHIIVENSYAALIVGAIENGKVATIEQHHNIQILPSSDSDSFAVALLDINNNVQIPQTISLIDT